jgi:hypothetical protein
MAGAGYKLFNTGDVLTAAQVNTYLNEQTVMVFADSAARTTALSGVLAEGMMSYLQDTDSVEVYDGTSWTAIGGGGLSSPLTTKGDVWGYSTTDARIPVGANGTVLTADSVETLGVKWAAPAAGGGMTLLSTTTLTGASTTISGISGSYKNLYIEVDGFYPDSANSIRLRINGLTTGVYRADGKGDQGSALATSTLGTFALDVDSVSGTQNFGYIYINNYASATNWKILDIYSVAKNNNGATYVAFSPGYVYVRETNAVTSITLFPVSGNWSAGTVRVYGVN